ncbi:MAG: TIGR02206 family membrane protein [Proteocatella sp.]
MFNLFWEPFNTGEVFIPFNMQHLIALGIIGIMIFTCFKFEKIYKKYDRRISRILSILMFLQQLLLYIWYINSGSFSAKESLPLYTCRIAIIISIFMLLKPRQWMVDIVYFWGFVGSFVALLSPDTSTFTFPHFMFLQYFIGHGLLIFTSIYMIVIKKYNITVKSFIRALKVTLMYVICIIPINYITGGNYAYLSGKPKAATILDILPPYPYYIPIILLFMATSFFIALLPFILKEFYFLKKDILIKKEYS